jgi:hypothetical protein
MLRTKMQCVVVSNCGAGNSNVFLAPAKPDPTISHDRNVSQIKITIPELYFEKFKIGKEYLITFEED